jgi:hypothetical protein
MRPECSRDLIVTLDLRPKALDLIRRRHHIADFGKKLVDAIGCRCF